MQSLLSNIYRSDRLNFIGVVVCLLSKFHNNHMALFQKLITALLYFGHCATMVSISLLSF